MQLTLVLGMYVTLLPVILAGVLNMVFVKSTFLNGMKHSMDGKRLLADHRRLFGDNKTWKGFWGMVALTGLVTVIWGFMCSLIPSLSAHDFLYHTHANTVVFNMLVGCIVGFAYVLFELPNSYMKRRLGIGSGKTPKGLRGIPFLVLDQVDSLFGCVLVVSFFYPMTVWFYLAYVTIGGATHIVTNVLLYVVKLKKNV